MLTHHRFERYFDHWLSLPPEDALWTEAGFITNYTHLGDGGTQTMLEDWQVLVANNPAGYSWLDKSRQIGFSWIEAMKKLARSYLIPKIYTRKYLGIFLSLNQDEAKEKIFYLLGAHDTLPNWLKKGPLKLIRASTEEIQFANGARVYSYPAKAVRGKAGADVTADEFAHIPKVKSVYEGTTASTIRAKGLTGAAITVGSTPLTDSDLFFQIGNDPAQFKTYNGNRYYVRWWDSLAICRDPRGARRAAEAESWLSRTDYDSVQERVERFGSERLQQEFGSLPLESFLQEYEGVFGANKNAFIPYSLLVNAQVTAWPQVMYVRDGDKHALSLMADVWPEITRALRMVPEGGMIWAGYDVARVRDYAALVLMSPVAVGGEIKAAVLGRFLFKNVPFPVQRNLLMRLMQDGRIVKLRIDATGMGGPIAEDLKAHWGESRVEPVIFTNPAKLAMASRLKVLYEQDAILTGGDREIVRQTAAIQKTVTASQNIVIGGATEDSHSDLFWAMALAAEHLLLTTETAGPVAAKREEARMEREQSLSETQQLREEMAQWRQSRWRRDEGEGDERG